MTVARRRSRTVGSPPGGFRYREEFVEALEEQELLAQFESLPFEAVHMHGVEARRQVFHFGFRYLYESGSELLPAAPLPPFLSGIAERAAAVGRFPQGAPLEALITRYAPGAGIGWHRDAPQFGPVIVGLSLGASCEFRLRLATEAGYDVYKLQLPQRSLYVLSGSARFRWQHAIPPVRELRYSVTFRTVRGDFHPDS